MSERSEVPATPSSQAGRRTGLFLTFGAALIVLLLAVGALLFPAGQGVARQGVLLIFDPTGDQIRTERVFRPLGQFLEQITGHGLEVEVVRTREEFLALSQRGVDYLLCPDGLALQVEAGAYEPLALGRRSAPRNLRPRGVLVFRKAAGLVDEPWRTRPRRTVVGDSLSLCASGLALRGSRPADLDCAWGPDPYDHGPVLHAARLGACDYALVRQWDADRFFAEGLLSGAEWGVEALTPHVPDLVLLASRRVARSERMAVGEALNGFSRSGDLAGPHEAALAQGLPLLRLVGFNLLLEPDFERVRGIFNGHWQAASD